MRIPVLPNWLKNKYLIAGAAFAVAMVFFGENDLITQFRRTRELERLNQGKQYYQQQIAVTRKELKEIRENPASLEKIARERFFMKRDNEDVYVIPENSTNGQN